MAGKYMPLEKYFSDLPKSTHEITLSFEGIERILKFKLPRQHMNPQNGGSMRKRETISICGHGPTLDGKLILWITKKHG